MDSLVILLQFGQFTTAFFLLSLHEIALILSGNLSMSRCFAFLASLWFFLATYQFQAVLRCLEGLSLNWFILTICQKEFVVLTIYHFQDVLIRPLPVLTSSQRLFSGHYNFQDVSLFLQDVQVLCGNLSFSKLFNAFSCKTLVISGDLLPSRSFTFLAGRWLFLVIYYFVARHWLSLSIYNKLATQD